MDDVYVTCTLKCGALRQLKLPRATPPPPRLWCPSDEYDCEVTQWTSADVDQIAATVDTFVGDMYPDGGNWDRHRAVTATQSPRAVRKDVRRYLAAQTDGRCTYCGRPLPAGWHIDHITPKSGPDGTHDQWNLTPACPDCNLDKGARTQQEWRS